MQSDPANQLGTEFSPTQLQGGEIFGAIGIDTIDYLLREGELCRFVGGEHVFDCGDPGDHFFVICSGSVDFFRRHDGDFTRIRRVGFGEAIGFVAMIALHDHEGVAIACEDSLLLKISSRLFQRLHDEHPRDFGIMTLNLARHLARVIGRLGDNLCEHSLGY